MNLDQNGPGVNAVMEINPDALAMARQADQLRRRGQVLGPLHGIPVLLKGEHRHGRPHANYRGVAGPGRRTGAARFDGGRAIARGRRGDPRQDQSFGVGELPPVPLDQWLVRGRRADQQSVRHQPQPLRIELGSAAAASANFAAVSLGTETDGSIVCPGNASGVVAIKPTVGLTSRAGVVPISSTQDTVGACAHRGRCRDHTVGDPEPHVGFT